MNNTLYILVFFFKKRLELVLETGDIIRDIVNDTEIPKKQKVEQILLILEQLGLNELCYKKAFDDLTMRRVEFTPDILGDFEGGDYLIEFRTNLVEAGLMNGTVIFEITLN